MIENKNTQSGRSMIEMLGVLAIIGVLSVGGIAGYSKAMMKFKVNKTVDQVTQIATNIRTLFGGQRDYSKLTDQVIIKGLLMPDEMMTSASTAANISAAGTYAKPYYENAWGMPVLVTGGQSKVRNASGSGNSAVASDGKAFIITYTDVPIEACLELAVMDWGSSSGSGLVAFSVSGNGATIGDTEIKGATTITCLNNSAPQTSKLVCANANAQSGRVPMNPADAAVLCSINGATTGVVNMHWKFY